MTIERGIPVPSAEVVAAIRRSADDLRRARVKQAQADRLAILLKKIRAENHLSERIRVAYEEERRWGK